MTETKHATQCLVSRAPRLPARLAELCFFLTFFFTVYVYYPGATSLDTFYQYAQALSGKYSDWHPPVMAFVWSYLLFFSEGPLPMLLLHLGMLFLSLWMLYRHWNRVSSWSALFLLVPALPPVLIISGVIWKDVGLACSLLSVYALLICSEKCSKALKYLLYLLAIVLFLYAFLLRANALFACGPLLFYFFMQKFDKYRILRSFLASVAVLLLFLLSSATFNHLLKVEAYNPTRVMRVDEIAATSVVVGKNLFFPELGEVARLPLGEIPPVPVAKGWEFYLKIFSNLMNSEVEKEKIIYANWKYIISNHTKAYLYAKVCLFKNFMFKNWAEPFLLTMKNEHAFKDLPGRATPLGGIYTAVVDLPYPLYIVYAKPFWLTIAALLFLYASFPKNILQQHIRALTSSSVCYLVTFFLVTPTPDYRFIYWVVLATLVSLVLFVMDRARCNVSIGCSPSLKLVKLDLPQNSKPTEGEGEQP